MTKIINIENKNQLLAAKYEHERLIFLISGGFCKPCQVLKPNLHTLLENNDNYGIVLAKITYETAKDMKHETAKEMNEYFDLKKIPFLVCYNENKENRFTPKLQNRSSKTFPRKILRNRNDISPTWRRGI